MAKLEVGLQSPLPRRVLPPQAFPVPQPPFLTQVQAPSLPLLSPLGHLLLGCLAAVRQAVGGTARRLPLGGELLA